MITKTATSYFTAYANLIIAAALQRSETRISTCLTNSVQTAQVTNK